MYDKIHYKKKKKRVVLKKKIKNKKKHHKKKKRNHKDVGRIKVNDIKETIVKFNKIKN